MVLLKVTPVVAILDKVYTMLTSTPNIEVILKHNKKITMLSQIVA